MNSQVHNIRSEQLKPYIQYILFNQNESDDSAPTKSYPNTNICLGILKGNRFSQVGKTFVSQKDQDNIFAYTTGLYSTPHEFQVSNKWDEICIDFHPCGYFHFFDVPSKPKIFDEGFTNAIFSSKDLSTVSAIFEETDLNKRSIAIEGFLLSKLKPFFKDNLQLAIYYIHLKEARVTVKELLRYTKCSERKMYTFFMNYFGITPKQYIRILKIRRAIQLVISNPQLPLTHIAYECGYSDQSHFIKEAKIMCEILPKHLNSKLLSIDNQIIIGI